MGKFTRTYLKARTGLVVFEWLMVSGKKFRDRHAGNCLRTRGVRDLALGLCTVTTLAREPSSMIALMELGAGSRASLDLQLRTPAVMYVIREHNIRLLYVSLAYSYLRPSLNEKDSVYVGPYVMQNFRDLGIDNQVPASRYCQEVYSSRPYILPC